MDSYDVTFGPCDLLNPGHGYQIKVERNGHTLLRSNKHPVTGADLDYSGCLEVAGFYGPPRQEG